MRIGYACINPVLPDSGFKTCRKVNATPENLETIISANLDALESLIDYNTANGIEMFRIGSDLIPFASSEVNTLDWVNIYRDRFAAIGKKINSASMRVSMHPGQYTVINSPDERVKNNAFWDLNYHCTVLDLLDTDTSCKIILHIGGVYGDKNEAVRRFKKAYLELDDRIKRRLVIENDDRLYTAEDVLGIAESLNIPAVFDNLHNNVNPTGQGKDENALIDMFSKTWKEKDGIQKIHYSQQDIAKRSGAHSERIDADVFMRFVKDLHSKDLDIMLEVKDKNLSAVKCMNCLDEKRQIISLENEWSRYKYKILENSPSSYHRIRELLKDKSGFPVIEFYAITDAALQESVIKENAQNAALHVWGYFKEKAELSEKKKFFKYLENYLSGKGMDSRYKKYLLELAVKYSEKYLLDSYYFYI